MEQKFKFDKYQYVKIINAIDIDFPCKIEHRFFDGRENIYILSVGKEKSTLVPEINLELYTDNHIDILVFDMRKEILDLRKRIEVLEAGKSVTNQTPNESSLPASEIASGNERRYKYVEAEAEMTKPKCK
jgi:hypothetical protein|nr:MAG TPA: hypothetical protein [Caudoviricetes sp.]